MSDRRKSVNLSGAGGGGEGENVTPTRKRKREGEREASSLITFGAASYQTRGAVTDSISGERNFAGLLGTPKGQ